MFKLTPVTSTTLRFTETSHLALLPPADAVIVVVPSAAAVTTPPDTDATPEFELVHVTVLSVASEGETVAVRLTLPPTSSDTEVWLKEMPVTAITGSSFGPQATIERTARAAIIDENRGFISQI